MTAYRRALVGACVLGLLVTAVGVTPASAAIERCTDYYEQDPITVGVGGDPVATVGGWAVGVCVSAPDGVGGLPTPRLERYNCCGVMPYDWAIFLDQPASGSSDVSVTIRYKVDGPHEVQTVTIPVGGSPGSSRCLVFFGDAVYDPQGCELFLHH